MRTIRLLLTILVALFLANFAQAQESHHVNKVPHCSAVSSALDTCIGGREAGRMAWVNDAADATDCATGGGSNSHLCMQLLDETRVAVPFMTGAGVLTADSFVGTTTATLDATGAAAITIGSADVTGITNTTDGAGTTLAGVETNTFTLTAATTGTATFQGADASGASITALDTTGAGTIIAVDVSDYALDNALRLGATHAINPNKDDVRQAVYQIVPQGPDLVVEAAGPVEAVQMMFALCRRATRVNLFGITTHEEVKFDGGYTHFLETRMDSSFSVTPMSMVNAIRIISRGLIDPSKIITHRFSLSKINEAMEIMGKTRRNKVMIFPDEADLE